MRQGLLNLLPPVTVTALLLFWGNAPAALIDNRATLVIVIVTVVLFVQLLELRFERHEGWRINWRELATDVFYVVLGFTAISWMTDTFAEGPLRNAKETLGLTSPWLKSLPFLVQTFMVMALFEFGQYWMHRLMHNNALFWSTHAPHHHITQLNAAKGYVGNPIELFLISLSVIALFDFDKAAIFASASLGTAISTFAHANVRSDPPGWYSFFFTTIRHHSLHHTALSYEDTRCNYGNVLILYDRIFGTYREGESAVVGQDERQRLTIAEQFLFPFQPLIGRWKAKGPLIPAVPHLRLALLIPAAFALLAATPVEQIIPVPGFADFLTIDGNSVWVTNKGRVERWSRRGKLATVSMRHPCGTMALTADALWVADCDDKTLIRIDRRTARVTAVIATGIAATDGEMNVVAGAGSVWLASAASGVISRIDPALGRVSARIIAARGSNYLAFGHGALWAVSGSMNLIQKIDPATNRVIGHTRLGRQPGFLVAGEGAVWVQEQADGTVARVDPARVSVSGRIKVDSSLNYGDIDTGGGKIWLRTTARQSLVVIDAATLAIRARLGAVTGSGAVRYTPSGIWTSAHDRQSLSWWPDPARLSP